MSSGSDDDVEDVEGWVDDESSQSVCLFCTQTFPDSTAAFDHCETQHGFSIDAMKRIHRLDSISYIKLINYIRRQKPDVATLCQRWLPQGAPWDSDDFMKPTIDDDQLLMFDIDELSAVQCDDTRLSSRDPDCGTSMGGDTAGDDSHSELVSRLRAAEIRAEFLQTALDGALADINKMKSVVQLSLLNDAAPSSEHAVQGLHDDELYFESYSHFSIHQEMLSDRVRTESYRDAITQNAVLFHDKVVLDVGCGTGILSMFAARVGARRVIGVDQSDVIYHAMDIIRENDLESKVTLLKGRMEDVELPVDKVDIIISEWMGYLLLFESMLDTVLWARDHYLVKGGLILPDRCSISLVGLDDPDLHNKHVAFWDDVYGFRMSCMKAAMLSEVEVTVVSGVKVITEPCVIQELDLMTCSTKDLEFTSRFSLRATRSGRVTGLGGYFDIQFNLPAKVEFSTSPSSPPTHWKQTVFILEQPITVSTGECVCGQVIFKKNPKDPRSLKITIAVDGRSVSSTYLMQ